MLNFFIKFYRGQYPLGYSFWIVGFLTSLIISLFAYGIERLLINHFMTITSSVIAIVWNLFLIVGIWRSTNNYLGKKIWKLLARIFLIYLAIISIQLIYILF